MYGTYLVGTQLIVRGQFNAPESPDLPKVQIDLIVNNAMADTGYTTSNGSFYYYYTLMTPGTYFIYAKYDGSPMYEDCMSDSLYLEAKYNISINLNKVNDSVVGEEVPVEVKLSGTGLENLGHVDKLNLYEDDVKVGSCNLSYSTDNFTIKYTPTTIGNKTFRGLDYSSFRKHL